MKSNLKFFKKEKFLPVDKFFHNVLYDKKIGYYSTKQPFGGEGDFITAPKISNLFSEMIAIWIISSWEAFNKPKKINRNDFTVDFHMYLNMLFNIDCNSHDNMDRRFDCNIDFIIDCN